MLYKVDLQFSMENHLQSRHESRRENRNAHLRIKLRRSLWRENTATNVGRTSKIKPLRDLSEAIHSIDGSPSRTLIHHDLSIVIFYLFDS